MINKVIKKYIKTIHAAGVEKTLFACAADKITVFLRVCVILSFSLHFDVGV